MAQAEAEAEATAAYAVNVRRDEWDHSGEWHEFDTADELAEWVRENLTAQLDAGARITFKRDEHEE